MFAVPPEWRVTALLGAVSDGQNRVLIFETAANPHFYVMARMLGETMVFSGVAFPVPKLRVRSEARRALDAGWDPLSPHLVVRTPW